MQWKAKCAAQGTNMDSSDRDWDRVVGVVCASSSRMVPRVHWAGILNKPSKQFQRATVHKQERAQWDAKDDKQTHKRHECADSGIRLRSLRTPNSKGKAEKKEKEQKKKKGCQAARRKKEVQDEPPSHIHIHIYISFLHKVKLRRPQEATNDSGFESESETQSETETGGFVSAVGPVAGAGVARTWSILAKLKFMNR